MKSLIFAIALTLGFSAQATTRPNGFFDGMDQAVPTHSPASRLDAERYILLTARLSVFAMYCDLTNSQGLNTQAHQFRVNTTGLQSQAERSLGGMKQAYNRFETERNDESLRFKSFDQNKVCSQNMATFRTDVGLSAVAVQKLFSDHAFGQL